MYIQVVAVIGEAAPFSEMHPTGISMNRYYYQHPLLVSDKTDRVMKSQLGLSTGLHPLVQAAGVP